MMVKDCFQLIKNLLYKNISNQNYFRETSSIQKLYPFLEINSSDLWVLTDQQIFILSSTLDIICYFITGTNPNTHLNQVCFFSFYFLLFFLFLFFYFFSYFSFSFLYFFLFCYFISFNYI